MSMIERVARALYGRWKIENAEEGLPYLDWEELPASERAPHMADARAVLVAMRDPTEAMKDRGIMAAFKSRLSPGGEEVTILWHSMIGAALAQGAERE